MANPTEISPDLHKAETIASSAESIGRLQSWKTILGTCNLPKGMEKPDFVSRWMVISRACVFSMTLFSGLIGGMLAVWIALRTGENVLELDWLNFVLAIIAIVICHPVNNMLNDYFDYKTGVDDAGYVRAQYSPHPIISGMTSTRGLLTAVTLLNVAFILIALFFFYRGYELALLFAVLGLFLSFAYVAPPFSFKKRGLGELTVFVVWGPLMTGVVFYVMIGRLDLGLDSLVALIPGVFLSTIPYGLTVTTVLFGKHIDKLAADKAKSIHTLPVILGEPLARKAVMLLMISFYPLIFLLVWAKILGIGVLIVVLGLPYLIKSLRVYNSPRPETPGPLYYVGWSFYHNRVVGGLFFLGLIVNVVLESVSRGITILQI